MMDIQSGPPLRTLFNAGEANDRRSREWRKRRDPSFGDRSFQNIFRIVKYQVIM